MLSLKGYVFSRYNPVFYIRVINYYSINLIY
jgi:hypothetical protein